jgi:hypothetical protein
MVMRYLHDTDDAPTKIISGPMVTGGAAKNKLGLYRKEYPGHA